MPADPAVRVLIAEPHELHAAVLAKALDDDRFDVAGYAGAVPGLVAAAAGVQVLVVGPTMSRVGLPGVIPRLVAAGARLLVISESEFDEAASTLLFAGATGFLSLADSGLADVGEAVSAIARGSTALNPDVVHDVLSRWREQRTAPPADLTLTEREQGVLDGLRDGLTTRLLARRLGVAEKTVETHKSKLYAKLGARNQAQAVRIALDQGLI